MSWRGYCSPHLFGTLSTMDRHFLSSLFGTLLITGLSAQPPVSDHGACLNLARGAYTYEVSGGSLGDHLLSYARARWLSYRHQLPLIVRHFPYSDQLCVHGSGFAVEDVSRKAWERRLPLVRDPLSHLPKAGEIQEVPWFPESLVEAALHYPWVPYFELDWSDRAFLQQLRQAIRPLHPMEEPPLPQDRLCIAIHCRRNPSNSLHFRGRPVTPMGYYQRELQKLARRAANRPLFVALFTDDPYPNELLTSLKEALSGLAIEVEWHCRGSEIPASHRVLADLFHMARFDVLVRGESAYSLIAGRIGDVALEISPTHLDPHSPGLPSGNWRVRPGISLESLFDGWRVRWCGL
jgi:hypothetical protein